MKNKVLLVLTIFFTFLFVFSLFNIIRYIKNNKENKEIQEETLLYVQEDDDKYSVNFKELLEQNEDTIAYLKVGGTNIDYIVVQASDNEYYLNHNFNKKYNVSGWIFSDYHNKFDGSDKNIVIYGHNTSDGSMFGTLKNTLNSDWQNSNNEIVLVTEVGTYYYQVFSTYTIEPEEYYINTSFTEEEFDSFIKELKKRSNHDYKVDVNYNDSILTLSSCTVTGKKRVVLHAKLIKDVV